MFTAKDAKFHKIKGTSMEWVEYPEEFFYDEDRANPGNTLLVVNNLLMNQPQLIQELKELYGSQTDVMEKWARIEVERNESGKVISHRSIVHNATPPIIKEGFTHVLTFSSDDKNYLEFIKWDICKKLKERQSLSNLDISTVKDEVPEVLTNLQPEDITTKEYTCLSALFEDMNRIVNNFFKQF